MASPAKGDHARGTCRDAGAKKKKEKKIAAEFRTSFKKKKHRYDRTETILIIRMALSRNTARRPPFFIGRCIVVSICRVKRVNGVG